MKWPFSITSTSIQRTAAGVAVVTAIALSASGVFVAQTSDVSTWRLLLSDRMTLGLVRLAVISLALYVISSVAALAVAARWMKALGTGGLEADEPRLVDDRLDRLETQLHAAEAQREEAFRLLREHLNG